MEGCLEKNITRLQSLNLAELREEWVKASNKHLPTISSAETIRNLIAWNLQAKTLGGLSETARRRLKDLYEGFEREPNFSPSPTFNFKSGTVLTRNWNGTRHDVLVEEMGFRYQGQEFQNLSEIASDITGSRWSGPAFFGLKEKTGTRKKHG